MQVVAILHWRPRVVRLEVWLPGELAFWPQELPAVELVNGAMIEHSIGFRTWREDSIGFLPLSTFGAA